MSKITLKSSKRKIHNKDGAKCYEKWIKIPREEHKNYDTSVKQCSKHNETYKYPYLVHNPNKDAYYSCYLCDEDVAVRYMCNKCRNKG